MCALPLAVAMVNTASAELVTGWGLETGFQNATLTEGVAGSFSTTTPSGNAAPRAVLSSPIDFSTVGAAVTLSGSVSFVNTLGNQQFRFGLFNNNGQALGTLSGGLWSGASAVNWLGYIVEAGNNGGTTALYGRNGSGGTRAWLSTTAESYLINGNPTSSSPTPGTYSFNLTLNRSAANTVNISYSLAQTSGGTYSTSGTFTDNGGLSSGISSFNTVGFLLNGNTGAGTLSDITVAVPEPSVFALGLLGLAGATFLRRR